jgi:hypothetical protein
LSYIHLAYTGMLRVSKSLRTWGGILTILIGKQAEPPNLQLSAELSGMRRALDDLRLKAVEWARVLTQDDQGACLQIAGLACGGSY